MSIITQEHQGILNLLAHRMSFRCLGAVNTLTESRLDVGIIQEIYINMRESTASDNLANIMKPVFFWGIGNICQMCHMGHPGIKVNGYIDSNYEDETWNGKPVMHPDDVKNWHDIFTVITIKYNDEVKEYLTDQGLAEGTDYVDFRDYFAIEETDPMKDLARISLRMEREGLIGRTLLFAPLFISRVSYDLIHFFREYVAARQQEGFILMTGKGPVSEKRGEELMGFPVICYGDEPEIRNQIIADESVDVLCGELDDQDKKYVVGIEKSILNGYIIQDSYDQAIKHYGYYKKLIDILKPTKLMIWGGWARPSFYFRYIAQRKGIPVTNLEHGVIPGTIQNDREGIAGYGEIAKNSAGYETVKINATSDEYESVRDRIISKKSDTGSFRRLKDDTDQLRKLDIGKKTVFLVGTGYGGWDVEEGSDFWHRYVSGEMATREEAYNTTKQVCVNNGWNMIYKPHPGSRDYYCDQDKENHNIAVVRYMDIDELIKISSVVVTLSTAVCYKVLFYEKPLVEIGRYLLWGKGCSYEVKGDYENRLREALDNGITAGQKKCFREHIMKLLHYNHWDDLTHPDMLYGRSITEDII